MPIEDVFKAWGHPNIRPRHKTTLMVTKDTELTHHGDCVVSVQAEKGLKDLDSQLKEMIRNSNAMVRLVIEVEGNTFEISGRGDQRLSLSHPTDIVVRKSSYICNRTLMIHADRAACDLDKAIVKLLQDREQVVNITISVEIVTQMVRN